MRGVGDNTTGRGEGGGQAEDIEPPASIQHVSERAERRSEEDTVMMRVH